MPRTPYEKALKLNLDPTIYGTLAEIGGGQEVARYFFQVGAASGTVAKAMSAYDMIFSDEIYGKVKRYVSRERLMGMLSHEYRLIEERLGKSRGEKTRFFTFADTVATRNFQGTNDCHGWMGIRFQSSPLEPPSEIILHVRMLDEAATMQQEALGRFGINLIHSAYYLNEDPERMIGSLADGLGTDRIEVEVIEVHGPKFEHCNQKELNLILLEKAFTNAILFGEGEYPELASETLYKRPVLIQRGSYRPITKAHIQMMSAGMKRFKDDYNPKKEPVQVYEMTVRNLLERNIKGRDTFLALADTILALGHRVLITDYRAHHRLIGYLRRYTPEPIGFVLGANNMYHLFEERFYDTLSGGLLEGFGRLFKQGVTLYVYPMRKDTYTKLFAMRGIDTSEISDTTEDIVTIDTLRVPGAQRLLFRYLRELGHLRGLKLKVSKDGMETPHSSAIRELIRTEDPSWEWYVPSAARKVIKRYGLFR